MIHPVFRLAASQPRLLVGHVGAYADLLHEELALSGQVLQQRLLWQLACALCLTVTAVLAGVALLMWATLPLQDARAAWLLVVTPLLPLALGMWAADCARRYPQTDPFARLRAQLAEDTALLARHTEP